jgi:hypothetical protein
VERLFEKICSLNEGMSYLDLGDDILVEDGIGVPPQRGLPLRRFFELLFERPAPALLQLSAGACFSRFQGDDSSVAPASFMSEHCGWSS